MRNLKNINHWIAELREIASTKYKLVNEDNNTLGKKEINEIFNKDKFKQWFDDGLTPQETIEEELLEWESGSQKDL